MSLARSDVAAGGRCPSCGGYGVNEPGAFRCLRCSYSALLLKILPIAHPDRAYSDVRYDRANRERQYALDSCYLHPARVEEFIHTSIDRMRGRRDA